MNGVKMKQKYLVWAIASLLPITVNQSVFAETTLSGLIEAEAIFLEDEDDTGITVELGIDHKVSEKVDAHVLFLHEQDQDDDIIVDEAVINLHPSEKTDIAIGRLYVPFGSYDTHMVTDPVTLDIGESQEEAVQLSQKFGGITASAYVFKDKAEGANSKIDNGGLSLTYESDRFTAGVGYLSDVADHAISGINVHLALPLGSAKLIAEHTSLDTINDVDPSASHLEVGFDLGGDKVIAASYQKTSDADLLDLPEEVVGVAYTMPVYKNTSIAAEYLRVTAYDDTEEDVATLKVSYEF